MAKSPTYEQMAKFPTYEHMAKNVADKALDEFLYDGKSIREWMKIIAEQEPKTDCITIPKDATNGDVIKTMFNCMVIDTSKDKVYVEGIFFPFDEYWWNAPYKDSEE